jgi:hypothetical protein
MYSKLCLVLFSIAGPLAQARGIPRGNLSPRQPLNETLLTDLTTISGYWGQITPYSDNPDTYFGVDWVGLPSGCQIEQVHTLQRHANRFPTSGTSRRIDFVIVTNGTR